MAKIESPPLPRRTRGHVIADLSHNYVERYFLEKGHTVNRPKDDYGTDMIVNTFDEQGYVEDGDIRIQLKASDGLDYSRDGKYISFKIEAKHYHHWIPQPMPVFLILYDAQQIKAYWLYIQAYFAKAAKPGKKSKTVTVRVPVANELTAQSINYMRQKKAAVVGVTVKHEE